MPIDPIRAKDIFLAALEKPAPAEQSAFLEQACGGEPELRRYVEDLLQAHGESKNLLDHPAVVPPGVSDTITQPGEKRSAPPTEAVGTVLAGRYKLIQLIGEGGMGNVFMAEQTQPIKRLVAVKVVKAGMGSRTVLARFESERQALALMDHPNIAKVLDAGLSEHGHPFFVMELVKGVPLTQYCDDRQLSVADRLQIFQQICHAVQHAHQKGIVHRDLKPGNILVESHDGRAFPKVIDFGLAKAVNALPLTERSLYTHLGAVLGTPLYMAPEQAEFSAIDVDTRADIYALGVILYKLLTGTTPLEKKRLAEALWDEIRRVIKEEEPLKPSMRLSTSEARASIAAQRQSEPNKLGKFVRGDLDWIVMKALAKERDRRYETANAFAADVQRFLRNEPVSAGPPTMAYKLQKFVRRNRGPVLAATFVFLALLAGVIGTGWGLVRAEQARRNEAEQRKLAFLERANAQTVAEAERAAREVAQKRLVQLEKANEILGSIFKDLNPKAEEKEGKPLRLLLGERLKGAVKQLEGEAVGDPVAVARMQRTLGWSLLNLGYTETAIDLFVKARATCATHLGPDHPDTLSAMHNLAAGYREAGNLTLALPLLEETLMLRKKKLGVDHPKTLDSMDLLAGAYRAAKKPTLALPLLDEILKVRKAKLGPDHPDTLGSMNNLALAYYYDKQFGQALPLYEEALKRSKDVLGANHFDTLQCMNNLALCYTALREPELALPIYEETLRLRRANNGPDHPHTLITLGNLAGCYLAADKPDLALPLFRETAAGIEKRQFVHEYAKEIIRDLIGLHERLGQYDQAEIWRRKWLAVVKAREGAESSAYAKDLSALATRNLFVQKKYADAETVLREFLAIRMKIEPDLATTFTTRVALVGSMLDQAKYGEAEPLIRECLAHRTAKGPIFFHVNQLLLDALMGQRKFAEAETVLRELLASRAKKGPNERKTSLPQFDERTAFHMRSKLGRALLGQQMYAEAEQELLQGFEGLTRLAGKVPPHARFRVKECVEWLIQLYDAWQKPDEAAKWREVLYGLAERLPEPRPVTP